MIHNKNGRLTISSDNAASAALWAMLNGDSTLTTWLDASDVDTVTLSSGKITDLADKAGSNDFSQNGADPIPTYATGRMNGLPAAVFNGDDEYLQGPALSALITASAGYLIAAVNPVGSSTNNADAWKNDALFAEDLGTFGLHFKSTADAVGFNQDSGAADEVSEAITFGTPHILEYWHQGGSILLRVNGSASFSSTSSGNTTNLTNNTFLGQNYNQTAFAEMDLGEILIFNALPASGLRHGLRTALGAKWGA